jgi:hypothetical protein
MSKIASESLQHLSTADLWAMYQYAEKMRIEAQKAYDLYKSKEYASRYKSKVDYWVETMNELSNEISRRINEINPMYPK